MSEIAFPWIALRRSDRAQRLARSAFALTGTSLVLASTAALLSPTPLRVLAAIACAAVLAVAWFASRRPMKVVQLRVTPEADILMRAEEGSEAQVVQSRFVTPWLIVLGDRAGAVPVWPDRLGALQYRRLAVACRWHRPGAEA